LTSSPSLLFTCISFLKLNFDGIAPILCPLTRRCIKPHNGMWMTPSLLLPHLFVSSALSPPLRWVEWTRFARCQHMTWNCR
jgi:hypothetical protein